MKKDFLARMLLISVLMILNVSCATSQTPSPMQQSQSPSLNQADCSWSSKLSDPIEMRTWRICKSLDGFCYQWRECKKKFMGFGWCTNWALEEDKIPFANTCMVQRLIDKNFHLKVRSFPK